VFVFLVTLAAAQSAALMSAPAEGVAPPAAATPAPAAKPRKKKCVTNDEMAVGSHIFMDTCHTEPTDATKGFRDYHAYATEYRGDKNVPH